MERNTIEKEGIQDIGRITGRMLHVANCGILAWELSTSLLVSKWLWYFIGSPRKCREHTVLVCWCDIAGWELNQVEPHGRTHEKTNIMSGSA
jgi:hypothetical protein